MQNGQKNIESAEIITIGTEMLLGDLVEVGETQTLFTRHADPRTEQYISGRFG